MVEPISQQLSHEARLLQKISREFGSTEVDVIAKKILDLNTPDHESPDLINELTERANGSERG